jgi:hypothetical protein
MIMSTQYWNSAKQGTKNPLLGFLMAGMTLAYVDILLNLINLLKVARGRIELPTRGFSGSDSNSGFNVNNKLRAPAPRNRD